MTYLVTMRDNKTQEEQVIEMDGEYIPYLWEEGNFACDCNRAVFFTGDHDIVQECGESRFDVLAVEFCITGGEPYDIDMVLRINNSFS